MQVYHKVACFPVMYKVSVFISSILKHQPVLIIITETQQSISWDLNVVCEDYIKYETI